MLDNSIACPGADPRARETPDIGCRAKADGGNVHTSYKMWQGLSTHFFQFHGEEGALVFDRKSAGKARVLNDDVTWLPNGGGSRVDLFVYAAWGLRAAVFGSTSLHRPTRRVRGPASGAAVLDAAPLGFATRRGLLSMRSK